MVESVLLFILVSLCGLSVGAAFMYVYMDIKRLNNEIKRIK